MDSDFLWEKLGRTIQRGLQDPAVSEVMLNADGNIWFAYNKQGNRLVGSLAQANAENFVYGLADFKGLYLNDDKPYLDCTLPFNQERINIVTPPMDEGVSFNIRKPAGKIYTLEDYLAAKIITPQENEYLKQAIAARKNILISGSPASGKTTFINALLDYLAMIAPEGHRILLLEQVAEIRCPVANFKRLLAPEPFSLQTLVYVAMRNSPDRLIAGEVRDGAALDMLKAWNTGCRGGFATIHANSPQAAMQRVIDLSQEAVVSAPYNLAAESVDVVVQLSSCDLHPARRYVSGIVEVTGFDKATHDFIFNAISTGSATRVH